jgi:hypothetical protein
MSVIVYFTKIFMLQIIFWNYFRIHRSFVNFSIMSKVFSDFYKIKSMNKGIIIGIPIIIAVIIGILAVSMMPEGSEKMEVEDTLDKEIRPEDNPEIEKKIKEIEKIADENEYEVLPREWQISGPFQVDRTQYALGEKIFIRIGGLQFQDIGQIAVMKPLNDTHKEVYLTIPFDGAKKDAFNYYLDPQLSAVRGYCSVDEFLGEWTIVFRGTNYSNLNFEIVNKTVPGTDWEPVC